MVVVNGSNFSITSLDVGPDDYASMQEVVSRGYSRMHEEGTPLPDLIITDGGKGQMILIPQPPE